MTTDYEDFERLTAIDTYESLTADLIAATPNIPDLFIGVKFSDAKTVIVFCDDYFAIQEQNPNEESWGWCALGVREGSGIKVVDVRFMDDITTFEKGISAFVNYIGQEEPRRQLVVEGISTQAGIVEYIHEVYRSHEKTKEIVVH